MNLLSIAFACVLSATYAVPPRWDREPGDFCLTKDNTNGTCTFIEDCQAALKINKRKRNLFLQRCGFEGFKEVICCPVTISEIVYDRIFAEAECNKLERIMVRPITTNIIGGQTIRRGQLPHTVALGYPVRDNNSIQYTFSCGGTILSPEFVVTAAHCLESDNEISPTIVRVGVIDISQNVFNSSTDIVIADKICHPNYTVGFNYHDIALLKLKKSLTFSKFINAACLETNYNVTDDFLEVAGWGVTNTSTNVKSKVLKSTLIKATPSEICNNSYQYIRKQSRGTREGQFCAGDKNGGHDSCHGDSGGPVTILSEDGEHYMLVGITSFGIGCGSSKPAIYTRVAYYVDWIVSLVWPEGEKVYLKV